MTGRPATSSSAAAILAPRLFDGEKWWTDVVVTIDGGKIAAVRAADAEPLPIGTIVLPRGAVLAPGFIDLQVNGGGGVLLNDAPTRATVATLLRAHRRLGTASCLPTLITSDRKTLSALADAAPAIASLPGVAGLHLEGPFLNPKRRGVHDEALIRPPDAGDIEAIAAIATATRVLVTLAPECVPSGFVGQLVGLGVIVAIGHSDATAAEARNAVDEGATAITHLFNAMSQLTPREPGVVGAALDDARLISSFICDGVHVAPANMRTAFKAAGRERMALITDAMPTVGSHNDAFLLGGRRMIRVGDRLTAPDGTLAGAHLGMIEAVRNATKLAGATLDDALVMASATPARLLGLLPSLGRVRPGSHADLTAFSPDFAVLGVWVGGESVVDW